MHGTKHQRAPPLSDRLARDGGQDDARDAALDPTVGGELAEPPSQRFARGVSGRQFGRGGDEALDVGVIDGEHQNLAGWEAPIQGSLAHARPLRDGSHRQRVDVIDGGERGARGVENALS